MLTQHRRQDRQGIPGMMRRVRLRVPVLVPALLLAVALLAGCSGDDAESSGDSSKTPSSDLPSQAALKAYFTAAAAYDVDGLAAAEEIAAGGSPAQEYAAYLGEFAASALAAGQPVAPAEVEEVDGDFKACGGTGPPDECVVWSGFEGKDGHLTGFTVNGTDVEDSLVDLTGQAPISSAGLSEVQPEHAYRSPQSGTLFVVVTITAGDVALSPRPGIYIEQDQILNGVATRAPATIDAGASSPVVLAFPDAQDVKLDGQVTFELVIPGGVVESIGFGLSDPA
jgi:hypothetical protein